MASQRPTTIQDVEAALCALEAWRADDRAEWIRTGQALHAFDSGHAGLDLWLRWSQSSPKFKPGECEAKWRTFREEKGVTVASLFGAARADGWKREAGRPAQRRELPPAPPRRASGPRPASGEKVCGWDPPGNPVAVYYYNRPDGSPLYRKVRYQTPRGKITPFQRYDAARDAWIGGEGCMAGVARVLYGGDRLPGFQRVFVVEGEKCADALWDFGLLAVCNDSGAGHWTPEFAQALRGKDVVILPDNDEPGRQHAALVARSLVGVARSIKVVELPGLGPKEDVYDWLTKYGEAL